MAVQAGSTVCGLNGRRYTLEKEIGAGGEGRVYRVAGENLVGKIYKKVDPEVEGKIRYMVQHPIEDLRDSQGKVILALAWPRDILCDEKGTFIGYTMPFIQNGVEICTVARGCDMPKAQAMFPDYNWMFNLQVALNLAKAVAYLHARNCIVGDLNCKNIMVSPGGLITMLDNDSFDLLDTASGMHFRCCAGTQDYLAPELQGRNLRSPGAVFSKHSDNFALAIHIFQLLMNNFHPFTGKNLVVIKDSTSTNQRLDHLVNGKCPFIHNYTDLTVPIGAPYLNEMVSQPLIKDFLPHLQLRRIEHSGARKGAHHRRPMGDGPAAVHEPVLYPGAGLPLPQQRKAFLPASAGQMRAVRSGCAARLVPQGANRKGSRGKACRSLFKARQPAQACCGQSPRATETICRVSHAAGGSRSAAE